MKKLFNLLLIVGTFTLAGTALAEGNEVLQQTRIEAVPAALNVILTRPSDQTRWLLKLKAGCPAPQAGQNVGLGVRGSLNGNNDYLDLGNRIRCLVQQALEFNEVLTVLSTNRTQAVVQDEKGGKFRIFTEASCPDLLSFVNQAVYLNRAGPTVKKGDELLVPGEPRVCFLKLVEPALPDSPPTPQPAGDIQAPSDVVNVRALPRTNGRVMVYWPKASDNVGIDHYVVSYARYAIDRKHLEFDSAEHKMETKATLLTIDGLQNDTDYYFYVLAVDAAGNRSSFWSEAAHGRPSSSLFEGLPKQTGQRILDLHLALETDRYFLFRWKRPPTTTRFMIGLTINGRPDFGLTNSNLTQIPIYKSAARRGQKLTLTISAFNTRSFIEQEKLEFAF